MRMAEMNSSSGASESEEVESLEFRCARPLPFAAEGDPRASGAEALNDGLLPAASDVRVARGEVRRLPALTDAGVGEAGGDGE